MTDSPSKSSSPQCEEVRMLESNVHCECYKIDWSGGPGNYKYVDTGHPAEQGDGVGCQDKMNAGNFTLEEYGNICHYIPGKSDSKFPVEVYKILSGE